MAKTVVGAEVRLEGMEKAGQSVGTLKKQLKEATIEAQNIAQKFGLTSKEAEAAARKVANLNDEIGDVKALTDSFNPDKKFVALGGALQGVTAGFSAVTGTMSLLGVEGAKTEEIMLKVQSAMALQQGISGVAGAIDSFKLLGAEILKTSVFQKVNNAATIAATAIQKLFGASVVGVGRSFNVLKGAIIATGIGALVVVIGILVDKLGILEDATDDAAEAQREQAEAIEKTKAAMDDIIKSNQQYIDRQIQLVKNTETINDLTAKGGNNQAELNRLKKENIQIELTSVQVELNSKKGLLTTQEELTLKAKEYQLQKQLERVDIEANTKAQEKQAEAAKKAADEMSRIIKSQLDLQKELSYELFKRRATDYEIELYQVEELYKKRLEIAKGNSELIQQVEYARRRGELDAIIKDTAKGLEVRKGVESQIQQTTQINEDAVKDIKLRASQGTTNVLNKQTKERISFAQLEAEQRIQFANDIGGALNALSDLIGKQTAAGKALGAAQALINTYIGVSEVIKAKSVLPEPFGTISKVANIAVILATGIKNVKALLSVKVPGGGGGGASVPAPVMPQAATTRLDQGSINAVGNAASVGRAYVTETDMTNNQEKVRRINRAARIN